uniref:Uncharacterized protein n=2 Tax=Ovis aries TaxID=9940 RepID=A0AC11DAA6_SHEEP
MNMNPPQVYRCVPHPELPSLFPPRTIPLGHPSAPARSIQYHAWNLDWRFVSYMILYTFQCHSPESSPPPPTPTESKRLFYTSVSLLLSRIQAYRYHLSKFHIYALEYYIGVFNYFMLEDCKITADGDCSHEIKRYLLLGRKVMTNLDSILKSRAFTLPTKVCLVKAMVFPVVTYRCESWTVKKVERQRIDAFELWCWRRLLRVRWTARRSNQSILKEISPGISLEGMMLNLKLQYFGHLM